MDEKKKNIIELCRCWWFDNTCEFCCVFLLYTYTTALFNSKCYSMDICSAVRLYSE